MDILSRPRKTGRSRSRRTLVSWLALGLALHGLPSGCSSGGRRSGPPVKAPPVLLSAVLIENQPGNSLPDAGESLELYLDESVELVPGAALDGSDLTLSAGSLGAVSQAPSLQDARRVRLQLGSGVTFAPVTTTIVFTTAQDAIRSTTTGRAATGGTAVPIKVGDGGQPVVTAMTLDAIPMLLNGTGPAGGRLQTPPNGFTVDLGYADPSPIDLARFQVIVDRPAHVGGAQVAAGTDLFGALSVAAAGNTSASFLVPAAVELPAGPLLLSVVVFDQTGMGSLPRTFPFQVAGRSDDIRPFETTTHASQVWLLDVSRDLETITSSGTDPITVTVAGTPNGRRDLEEILRVVGLQSATPVPVGPRDSNQVAMDLLQDDVLARLTALTPGVNVVFRFEAPSSFPGAVQVPYASHGFSRICIAGRSELGALGLAFFDANNRTQDDDCAHPGSSPPAQNRLGVFVHSAVSVLINASTGTLFRLVFDPFTPGRGTPIGNDLGDAARLQNLEAGLPGDPRQDSIANALEKMAGLIAVTVAHETGHSMGLVQDGPMPNGLYGGDPANFLGSTPGHIDLSSTPLFPPLSQEVMSPSISFEATDSPFTGFNQLELSYLRERVLYVR